MSKLREFSAVCRIAVGALAAVLMLASVAWGGDTENVLYSFQGGSDGSEPSGGVVFDQNGNLYGATSYGGGSSCAPLTTCGTVFELTPGAGGWTETVLYVFKGKAYNDGDIPSGGVILDGAGNLYGVTGYGGGGNCYLSGTKAGCGTVYKLTPNGSTWTETILYSFHGGKDGNFPAGNLVFDAAGNLYGSTLFGGGRGNCGSIYGYCGTIFELSPPSGNGGAWTEKVLYSFKGGNDGASPDGALIFDKQGALYGTTEFGGGSSNCTWHEDGCGTVFELKPPAKKGGPWTESLLHRFEGYQDGDGQWPAAGLTFDSKGNLYGMTLTGGKGGSGTVFQLRPRRAGAWSEAILYAFTGGNDGVASSGGLIFDGEGNLYGTSLGGSYHGAVFELSPPLMQDGAWTLTDLYDFKGPPDAGWPYAGVILDNAGNIYGTTLYGGTGQGCDDGCGTVFEVTP
jgi:uncharacterized repeat protein (TIGR03803 family)